MRSQGTRWERRIEGRTRPGDRRRRPFGDPAAGMSRLAWARAVAAVLLMLVGLSLSGCFFHTRTPEEPIIGGGCDFDFKFNDKWEVVIANMEGALGCGEASEYLKVLNDQFLYVPTATLVGQYLSAFATPWTKDREEIFIQDQFATALFSASLTDSILSGPDDDGTTIRLTARYRIQEVDAAGNPVGQLYTDTARFEFVRSSLFVEMTVWEDLGTGPLSFGQRRGEQGGGV